MHKSTPLEVDIDNEDGIEVTLMRHSARWHKPCRFKFSQSKFDQLEKNIKIPAMNPYLCRYVLALSVLSWIKTDVFFSCDESKSYLNNASTYYDIDADVHLILLF